MAEGLKKSGLSTSNLKGLSIKFKDLSIVEITITKAQHLQVHLLATKLYRELVFSWRKECSIEFDKLKGSAEERLESLHDLQIILIAINVLRVRLLDRHFHLQNLTVSAEYFDGGMDLHKVYLLCLLHLQFETVGQQIALEDLPLVAIGVVEVVPMVDQHVIHRSLTILEATPSL